MNDTAQRTSAAAIVAQRFATAIATRLAQIEEILREQLELQAGADRRNWLGAGTVQGGSTVGTAPATILEGNPRRTGLSVQNLAAAGGNNISIGIGNRAPQINTGITLPPGGSWDGRLSGRVCTQSISIVAAGAATAYSFVEAM